MFAIKLRSYMHIRCYEDFR